MQLCKLFETVLLENKDALIAKLDTTEEIKNEIKDWCHKHPNLDGKIGNLFPDVDAILEYIRNYSSKSSARSATRRDVKKLFENKDFNYIGENANWVFVQPLSYEACKYCDSFDCGGNGAMWCIGDSTNKLHYTKYFEEYGDVFCMAIRKDAFTYHDNNDIKIMIQIELEGNILSEAVGWRQTDLPEEVLDIDEINSHIGIDLRKDLLPKLTYKWGKGCISDVEIVDCWKKPCSFEDYKNEKCIIKAQSNNGNFLIEGGHFDNLSTKELYDVVKRHFDAADYSQFPNPWITLRDAEISYFDASSSDAFVVLANCTVETVTHAENITRAHNTTFVNKIDLQSNDTNTIIRQIFTKTNLNTFEPSCDIKINGQDGSKFVKNPKTVSLYKLDEFRVEQLDEASFVNIEVLGEPITNREFQDFIQQLTWAEDTNSVKLIGEFSEPIVVTDTHNNNLVDVHFATKEPVKVKPRCSNNDLLCYYFLQKPIVINNNNSNFKVHTRSGRDYYICGS